MKIAIVDEYDQLIGAKAPGDMSELDTYRVARLVIINAQSQVLLAQRALTKKKDPGLWGLAVEGTVEEGESYEANIRKEAEEEIGITLGAIETGPKLHTIGKYNHWSQLFIYRADLEIDRLAIQIEELAQLAWLSYPELVHDVAINPEKYGFKFNSILPKIEAYFD